MQTESRNLIYNKNPEHYGNGNDYFQKEKSKVVKEAGATLSNSVKMGVKPSVVFFTLLDKFAETRGAIALHTGTKDEKHYGLRRDSDAGVDSGIAWTPLGERYEEYGDKMCTHLQNILSNMPHDLNKFEKSTYSEESTCLGRKSSFEVEVFDSEALTAKKWHVLENPQEEEAKNLARAKKIATIIQKQKGVKEKFKFLKEKYPSLYVEDKMHCCVKSWENTYPSPAKSKQLLPTTIDYIFQSDQNKEYTAQNKEMFIDAIAKSYPVEGTEEEKRNFLKDTMELCFPSMKNSYAHEFTLDALMMVMGKVFTSNVDYRKSHWVLATSRLEINRNLVALSLYLTFMNFDGIHDPVDRMKGRSKVLVIHQDPFLIENTLKEISKIFEKAVLMNPKKEAISALIDEVGLMRYLFAHNMCLHNGSAAVGEWYEELVYDHHGLTASQNTPDKAVDLESLTALSLGDFLKVYREMTQVVATQEISI